MEFFAARIAFKIAGPIEASLTQRFCLDKNVRNTQTFWLPSLAPSDKGFSGARKLRLVSSSWATLEDAFHRCLKNVNQIRNRIAFNAADAHHGMGSLYEKL